jgi:hypothetical protein
MSSVMVVFYMDRCNNLIGPNRGIRINGGRLGLVLDDLDKFI